MVGRVADEVALSDEERTFLEAPSRLGSLLRILCGAPELEPARPGNPI